MMKRLSHYVFDCTVVYSKLTLARVLVGVNPVEECECTNPPDESKASPSLWPGKKKKYNEA